MLIAPLDRSDEFIYEADFVLKDNFDYNGKGRDHIYLCLSQRYFLCFVYVIDSQLTILTRVNIVPI